MLGNCYQLPWVPWPLSPCWSMMTAPKCSVPASCISCKWSGLLDSIVCLFLIEVACPCPTLYYKVLLFCCYLELLHPFNYISKWFQPYPLDSLNVFYHGLIRWCDMGDASWPWFGQLWFQFKHWTDRFMHSFELMLLFTNEACTGSSWSR